MRLDDTEQAAVLADAGLRLDRYLTDDRTWFRAVPAVLAAALAAERTTAGRGAVGAVHLARILGAFGVPAGVRAALTVQRLTEFSLHVIEVGLRGGSGFAGTGFAGTGFAGTGFAGTGFAGTGFAGTGFACFSGGGSSGGAIRRACGITGLGLVNSHAGLLRLGK
jgi:hypothetical protein